MKFRSRPFEIEATQFIGGKHPHVQLAQQFGEHEFYTISKQGPVAVNDGDWIIAEPDGSGHYPCAPDVFKHKYEPI